MMKRIKLDMRTMLRSKLTLLFMTLGLLIAVPAVALAQDVGDPSGAPSPAPPAPTIQSDKEDYPPAGTVILTGSGWQPGETVNINVNDDEGQTWNRNVDVIADENGNVRDEFVLPDWFVATYSVTATGSSGTTATSTFTDAVVLPARGCVGSPTGAATILVTTTADQFDPPATAPGDCSLREAISAANADSVDDTINLPPGDYTLTRSGAGEDGNSTGDLDVLQPLRINGGGARTTNIQAGTDKTNGIDRVLHVLASGRLIPLNGATVRYGQSPNGDGGGIKTDTAVNPVSLADVAITDNRARSGGGISASSSINFNRATISGNTASLDGGGLHSTRTGQLTNVTITGNTAASSGGGLLTRNENYTLINATVSHNSAPNGSNITKVPSIGAVTLFNTIVSDGSPGANCSGTILNGSTAISPNANNLESATNTCGFGSARGSKSGPSVNAHLGDLQNNGGSTDTRALGAQSAAIDAATDPSPAPEIDQRNLPRPKDGDGNGTALDDIGAYELQAPLNAAPVANDDAATTNEDTSIAIDVKANDTDANGNSLSVVATSLSDPANGTVALITSGADEGKVLYTPDSNYNNTGGGNADTFTYKVSDGTAQSNAATVRVTVNPDNDAPTTPGAITPTQSLNNDGAFTLDWGASTDVDGNDVTYTLEKRDSDDANWSEVASGLTSDSYTFGGTNPTNPVEDEGTWDYRVKAVDSPAGPESDYSTAENLVKVDKSGPNDPTLSFNTSANQSLKATLSGVDWYKDSALLDVAANGDKTLADTSAGSGVDAASLLPNPFSVSTNGTSTASRTVSDNATNESAAGTLQVNVDAANPTLGNGNCPTAGPFILNSGGGTQSVTITASDGESGVDNAASTLSGSVNTSTVGEKTVTFKAVDHVGHEVTKECNYNVTYDFSGFLQPINHQTGTDVSTFKAGSTVPVKLVLKDASGNVVQSASAPQWLTPQKGSATNQAVDESVFTDQATSGTLYKWDGTQYHYNWKTKGVAGSFYYKIGVKLDDGQTYNVNISLR